MSVIKIVKEAVQFYKSNVKILLLISLIEVLIGSISKVLLFFYENLSENITYGLGSTIIMLIMYIPMYFSMKLMVTMILAIYDLLKCKETSISKCYRESKEVIWRFIGKFILYFLAIFIPSMIVFWGFNGEYNLVFKMCIVIIGGIPLVYIATVHYFVSFAAVLKRNEKSLFRFSRELVKGSFVLVMIIGLIPLILQSPISLVRSILYIDQMNIVIKFVFQVITSVYSCIIFPFNMVIGVITMNKLERKGEKEIIKNVT